MAEVGFLSPEAPRFCGTVEAIERELMESGLVLRYRPSETEDGLSGDEGTFLVCGNFPQAFSHVGLINTAYNLRRIEGPAHQRADLSDSPGAGGPSQSAVATMTTS
jgi:GH15 family glucan-1,4-alpha-glucosidase